MDVVSPLDELARTRRELRLQAAIARVALLVAGERPAGEVFTVCATEARAMFDVELGAVVARDDSGDGVVVGLSLDERVRSEEVRVGLRIPLDDEAAPVAMALRRRRPARVEYGRFDTPIARLAGRAGIRSDVASPILVGRQVWGAVLLATMREGTVFPENAEDVLDRFCELVGLALANAERRATLVAQATSDPLTGLGNQRAFYEALHREAARARRASTPLALALFDLDALKQINDRHGHAAGDDAIRHLAGRLARAARASDTAARISGDEFALVMPDTDAAQALLAAERLRRELLSAPDPEIGVLTMSVGVADLVDARGEPDELHRVADRALHTAKLAGRGRAVRYDASMARLDEEAVQFRRLAHQQLGASLRALARAIDAKDRRTLQHSDRVAHMAGELARTLGWNEHDAERLYQAATLHDVGKIGVPDDVLLKDGPLTPEEYDLVKRHPGQGAEIVAEVLDADQVAWIRHHHERPDGRGYPDGLEGTDVPDGARILGVADAWDAMTADRPYRPALERSEALRVCAEQAGRQFDCDVVAKLEQLVVGQGVGL